jgi:hypothetical protein
LGLFEFSNSRFRLRKALLEQHGALDEKIGGIRLS